MQNQILEQTRKIKGFCNICGKKFKQTVKNGEFPICLNCGANFKNLEYDLI